MTTWCEKQLQSGDTLASLSSTFGVGAREIARRNGVAFTTPAINQWVISTGGRWLPHVPGTPRVPGSPTGGWAVWTDRSRILLPCAGPGCCDDVSDDDTPAPRPTTPRKAKKSNAGAWLLGGIALATVGGVLLTFDDDKKGR